MIYPVRKYCKYELCLEVTEEYMRKAHKIWFYKGSAPSYSQQAWRPCQGLHMVRKTPVWLNCTETLWFSRPVWLLQSFSEAQSLSCLWDQDLTLPLAFSPEIYTAMGPLKPLFRVCTLKNKIPFANKFQRPVRYSPKVSIFKEENEKVQRLQRKERSYISNYLWTKFKACF